MCVCKWLHLDRSLLKVEYQDLYYRIAPNFRGAKFSWIGLLKHFAEINFTDQRFLMAVPVFQNISLSLIFAVQEESTKTAKIMRLENFALYGSLIARLVHHHPHTVPPSHCTSLTLYLPHTVPPAQDAWGWHPLSRGGAAQEAHTDHEFHRS